MSARIKFNPAAARQRPDLKRRTSRTAAPAPRRPQNLSASGSTGWTRSHFSTGCVHRTRNRQCTAEAVRAPGPAQSNPRLTPDMRLTGLSALLTCRRLPRRTSKASLRPGLEKADIGRRLARAAPATEAVYRFWFNRLNQAWRATPGQGRNGRARCAPNQVPPFAPSLDPADLNPADIRGRPRRRRPI